MIQSEYCMLLSHESHDLIKTADIEAEETRFCTDGERVQSGQQSDMLSESTCQLSRGKTAAAR